jgi:hypothetical protein
MVEDEGSVHRSTEPSSCTWKKQWIRAAMKVV